MNLLKESTHRCFCAKLIRHEQYLIVVHTHVSFTLPEVHTLLAHMDAVARNKIRTQNVYIEHYIYLTLHVLQCLIYTQYQNVKFGMIKNLHFTFVTFGKK